MLKADKTNSISHSVTPCNIDVKQLAAVTWYSVRSGIVINPGASVRMADRATKNAKQQQSRTAKGDL